MAKLELVGLSAERAREQLMAKADAKDWLLADKFLDFFDDFGNVGRVARAVGEEDAVRLEGQD